MRSLFWILLVCSPLLSCAAIPPAGRSSQGKNLESPEGVTERTSQKGFLVTSPGASVPSIQPHSV